MIVGCKENEILKINIEVETNHIKLNVETGVLMKVVDFINSFNTTALSEKNSEILVDEANNQEISEETIREKFKQFVLDKNDVSQYSYNDFIFSDESFEKIRTYKGKSIDIVDNLRFFNRKILNRQTMEMVSSFIDTIEEIKIEQNTINDIVKGIREYVIYMGPNEKYRGCIGKVVRYREDDNATHLIEFPNKFRDSGRIARFWSKPENIVFFEENEV